jgi:hypothetical protein
MACISAITRVRVRTTPLTCGSHASVAIRMRIGRRPSNSVRTLSRTLRMDGLRGGGPSVWRRVQKAPIKASRVGKYR